MLANALNHLWQSTLLLAAIAALIATLRGERAQVRYWLWWAASVKFLVPFSLLTMLGGALGGMAPARHFELAAWPAALGAIAEPLPSTAAWSPFATALVVVWALGCAAVAGAWGARALKLRALLRSSKPYAQALPRVMGGPRAAPGWPEARAARTLTEPALVGIIRPVLLLPEGIADHLPPAQLAAVLEHEVAHWRRRDNLTAAMHMVVEAVFWFHPLVWWLGGRLVEERERACDEAVVNAGHDGRSYAEGILNVCERYVASTLKCAAGISGAALKRRVVEIARRKVMSKLPIRKKLLVGSFAFGTVLVPVIFGASAQGDDDPMPVVRMAPVYPAEALADEREGFVELEFTIAENGTTKNVIVVDSSSPEFEEPAITALLGWRYLPTNTECTAFDRPPAEGSSSRGAMNCRANPNVPAVERLGIRTTIRYELANVDPQAEAD